MARESAVFVSLAALAWAGAACSGKRVEQGHESLNAVLWTQTAAEYRGLAEQSYALAARALDEALADRRWTAATEQETSAGYESLPPAVILDVDETVLDNSSYQARLILDSRSYDEATWQVWCRELRAKATPGALAFTRYAREQGVAVIYVTNRRKAVEDATVENLTREGFDVSVGAGEDRVLTRGENGWDSSDKTARRKAVASRYRILLLVGDNFGDFVDVSGLGLEERAALYDRYRSYWGTRWIVLPNAQYGSWESAVFDNDFSLTDEERLERKRERLSRN